jgi:GTPase SAR1 family protein
MLVSVCGGVGKTSLIQRISTGAFSVQYRPTHFTEISKITMGGVPVALVETADVIACDLAVIVCRHQSEAVALWRAYLTASKLVPVVVRVGENLEVEQALFYDLHEISNLTGRGIPQLICAIYLKSKLLT